MKNSGYDITRSPPVGASINDIMKRLFSLNLPQSFPKDYKFHWNRASFAFNYYQFLSPLLDSKTISYRELIQIIQNVLGHSSPETTENYLKLFIDPELLNRIQSDWEEKFFTCSASSKYMKVNNQ